MGERLLAGLAIVCSACLGAPDQLAVDGAPGDGSGASDAATGDAGGGPDASACLSSNDLKALFNQSALWSSPAPGCSLDPANDSLGLNSDGSSKCVFTALNAYDLTDHLLEVQATVPTGMALTWSMVLPADGRESWISYTDVKELLVGHCDPPLDQGSCFSTDLGGAPILTDFDRWVVRHASTAGTLQWLDGPVAGALSLAGGPVTVGPTVCVRPRIASTMGTGTSSISLLSVGP